MPSAFSLPAPCAAPPACSSWGFCAGVTTHNRSARRLHPSSLRSSALAFLASIMPHMRFTAIAKLSLVAFPRFSLSTRYFPESFDPTWQVRQRARHNRHRRAIFAAVHEVRVSHLGNVLPPPRPRPHLVRRSPHRQIRSKLEEPLLAKVLNW